MYQAFNKYDPACHTWQTGKRLATLRMVVGKCLGALQRIPPATHPFQRLGIDVLGPFPPSKSSYRLIIVAKDWMTLCAETQAISMAIAEEVQNITEWASKLFSWRPHVPCRQEPVLRHQIAVGILLGTISENALEEGLRRIRYTSSSVLKIWNIHALGTGTTFSETWQTAPRKRTTSIASIAGSANRGVVELLWRTTFDLTTSMKALPQTFPEQEVTCYVGRRAGLQSCWACKGYQRIPEKLVRGDCVWL